MATPPGCGDGVIDETEECDDAERNGVGECTPFCTIAVCGDSFISRREVCDEGDSNGVGLGDCAPDCTQLIEARTITMSYSYSTNGAMGGNAAIEHVDTRCENAGLEGYKAMFADGTNRRASTSPYAGDGQIDWALRPWTRYVRDDGELVWITDATALLGVRDGGPQPLLVPISESPGARAATGLRGNWVTELNSDCNNWTTNSTGASQFMGLADELDSEDFLAGITPAISPGNCGTSVPVYCVEQ